jgi:predicted short-subunit dehydrogenase-like oxidoreductase (DUF2520 family)
MVPKKKSVGTVAVPPATAVTGYERIDLCDVDQEQKELYQALQNKNYSIRDSRLVTHDSTSRTISCLNSAERTGCVVFMIL